MNSNITEKIDGHAVMLALPSIVNEETIFPQTFGPAIQKLKIDFSEVKYFNSAGIKNWINWNQHISSKYASLQLELYNVTAPFIRHIAVLTGMLSPKMVVFSFSYDYYCDDCQFEKCVQVDDFKNFEFKKNIPCENCNSEMELDLPIDAYQMLVKQAVKLD